MNEGVWVLKVECTCGNSFKAFSNHLFWVCPECKTRQNNNYEDWEFRALAKLQVFKECQTSTQEAKQD